MDTIFDTCGLMVVKLEEVNGIQPFVIKNTTNTCNNDAVTLAWIICGTIVLISIIAAIVVFCWKNNKKESKELTNLKGKVEKLEGRIIEKDEVKKKYTEKLAIFLEDLSKNEKYSKMKDISDNACKEYVKMLTHMAKDGNMDKYQSYENNDTPKK